MADPVGAAVGRVNEAGHYFAASPNRGDPAGRAIVTTSEIRSLGRSISTELTQLKTDAERHALLDRIQAPDGALAAMQRSLDRFGRGELPIARRNLEALNQWVARMRGQLEAREAGSPEHAPSGHAPQVTGTRSQIIDRSDEIQRGIAQRYRPGGRFSFENVLAPARR